LLPTSGPPRRPVVGIFSAKQGGNKKGRVMRHRTNQAFAKFQDWQLQRRLGEDEAGLSLVAYALGAAFIVVPMAIALFLFGQQASSRADADLSALLAASTPSLP